MRVSRTTCYRKLKPYKYKLEADFEIDLSILATTEFESKYVKLTDTGYLTIKKDYAWDGPSGPTLDTRSFMRGSLVHDALYQLMRLSVLDHILHREYADRLLQTLCLEDGMWPIRAWYVFHALRWFGKSNAEPVPARPVELFCAPRGK